MKHPHLAPAQAVVQDLDGTIGHGGGRYLRLRKSSRHALLNSRKGLFVVAPGIIMANSFATASPACSRPDRHLFSASLDARLRTSLCPTRPMLGIGLIGLGNHGSRYARHIVEDLTDAALVAVCRRNRPEGGEARRGLSLRFSRRLP